MAKRLRQGSEQQDLGDNWSDLRNGSIGSRIVLAMFRRLNFKLVLPGERWFDSRAYENAEPPLVPLRIEGLMPFMCGER